MYTGPHIIKDGLVFGYDTGYGIADNNTSTRFYPGENSVNLVTNGDFSNGSTGWTFNGSAASYSEVTTFQGRSVFKANGLTTYNDRGYLNQSINVTSGQTYTVSFSYYLISGQLTYDPDNANNSNSNFTSPTGEWKTHTHTFTAASSTLSINLWGVNANPGYWYITDIQCEQKTHRTPFVNGTRSNTASLIDLKRTVDIDVSNMSFDSTSQPTFDGTDDILNTGLFSGRNPSRSLFTIEAIVKSDTTSGSHMWVDATGNGSNQRLYCAHASTGSSTPLGIQDNGWSHSIPQDTDYHHYVITMNGSTAQLYDNSVAHSSKSYTSYALSGQINVGGRSGYRWNGEIPVFKIYDKVLTTAEITQSYNAYKNRFNI